MNDEVTLAGYDLDLGCRLEQIFLEDLRYADQVNLEEFESRGRGDRWREWMWSRIELVM